ncbi:MAG: hypothetical protein ACTJLM_01695 [Ehrlichia sp.]
MPIASDIYNGTNSSNDSIYNTTEPSMEDVIDSIHTHHIMGLIIASCLVLSIMVVYFSFKKVLNCSYQRNRNHLAPSQSIKFLNADTVYSTCEEDIYHNSSYIAEPTQELPLAEFTEAELNEILRNTGTTNSL